MNDKEIVIKEFQSLYHGLLENNLDESQLSRFDELVSNNQFARTAYIGMMNLDSMLMSYRLPVAYQDLGMFEESLGESEVEEEFLLEEPVSLEELPRDWETKMAIQQADSKPTESEHTPNTSIIDIIQQALPTSVQDTLGSSSFIAGCIVFSIGMFLLLTFMLLSADVEVSAVAKVSQTVNAVWADGSGAEDLEQLYFGRQLELESGLAQVKYTNGGIINLHGPTLFIVSGPNRGTLIRGKISALAEKVTGGFTVQTSVGKIVDLGTEFGVKVADDSDVEIHVFNGLVRLDVSESRSGKGNHSTATQSTKIFAEQSVFVDSSERKVKPIPYLPNQFARTYQTLQDPQFDDSNSSPVTDTQPDIVNDSWAEFYTEVPDKYSYALQQTKDVFPGDPEFAELKAGSGSYVTHTLDVTKDNHGTKPRSAITHYYGSDIDVTQKHRISFTIRIDEDFSRSGFNEFNDRYTIFDSSSERTGPYAQTAWIIMAYATEGSYANAEDIGTWCFYDGKNNGNTKLHADQNVNTDIALVQGGVYDFTITVNPKTKTYDATVTDGTKSFTASNLHWRSASDIVGGTFVASAWAYGNGTEDHRAFSIDNLAFESLANIPDKANHNQNRDAEK